MEIIVFTLAKFPTRWRLLREVDNDVLLSPWTPPAVWSFLAGLLLFLRALNFSNFQTSFSRIPCPKKHLSL